MASKKVYGGANHFKWEEALTDKYRDNYLGQTLAGSSRPTFNNPRPNAMWYLKDKDISHHKSPAEDLAAVKEQENRIMLQMMGLLPKDPPRPAENKIDRQDLMKILAKDGNKDAFDEADRGSGLGFGSVARHSKDLIDQVKKSDAASKYEPAEKDEERSTRFYGSQGEDQPVARGRAPADSALVREQSTSHSHSAAEKEKHKHKDKHKSKDKDKHKHKDKHKKKKRSRSRSRSRSPRSKGRDNRDDYDQRREKNDDRRSHGERHREAREERRRSPETRRSRLTPSPKRRRMDTLSPPRRRMDTPSPPRRPDDHRRDSRAESPPHRRRLDTPSPSPPRRRRMDTPSPPHR